MGRRRHFAPNSTAVLPSGNATSWRVGGSVLAKHPPRRTGRRERDNDMTQTDTMTPEPPQRLQALERANLVRLARAELKRRIADGDVSAAEVILHSPWEASSWSVGELLVSQRRWGTIRTRKLLASLQISETRTVSALTVRQREVLAAQLESSTRELALV